MLCRQRRTCALGHVFDNRSVQDEGPRHEEARCRRSRVEVIAHACLGELLRIARVETVNCRTPHSSGHGGIPTHPTGKALVGPAALVNPTAFPGYPVGVRPISCSDFDDAGTQVVVHCAFGEGKCVSHGFY